MIIAIIINTMISGTGIIYYYYYYYDYHINSTSSGRRTRKGGTLCLTGHSVPLT